MIRKIEIKEVSKLYRAHIKKDFPHIERPPCFVIKNNMKNGIKEGYLYIKDNTELAYSINAIIENFVLISLFAVFSEHRNQGIGTTFLKEMLDNYIDKKGIILEVEKPENAKRSEEKEIRNKRISFYENIGFTVYKDIEYSIFKVPMYLMVFSNTKLTKNEIVLAVKNTYSKILRKRLQSMIKIS